MVHLLLALSFMLFGAWGLGMIGLYDRHTAWYLMLAGWFTFMAWCYAYYMLGAHRRGDWRDRHGRRIV